MISFIICKQRCEMGGERGIVREDRNGPSSGGAT